MKFAAKGVILLGLTAILAGVTGCHNSSTSKPLQWFPPAKVPGKDGINCVELKRQRLYNQTNMNTETNNTTLAQRQALDDLIAKNCK